MAAHGVAEAGHRDGAAGDGFAGEDECSVGGGLAEELADEAALALAGSAFDQCDATVAVLGLMPVAGELVDFGSASDEWEVVDHGGGVVGLPDDEVGQVCLVG
jgi:hypothetical protein